MTRKEVYREYLKSDHWRRLREACFQAQGRKCRDCGRERFLQVHHTIYRNRFEDSQESDLVVLCVYCHALRHGKTAEVPSGWVAKEKSAYRKQHHLGAVINKRDKRARAFFRKKKRERKEWLRKKQKFGWSF